MKQLFLFHTWQIFSEQGVLEYILSWFILQIISGCKNGILPWGLEVKIFSIGEKSFWGLHIYNIRHLCNKSAYVQVHYDKTVVVSHFPGDAYKIHVDISIFLHIVWNEDQMRTFSALWWRPSAQTSTFCAHWIVQISIATIWSCNTNKESGGWEVFLAPKSLIWASVSLVAAAC